MDQEQARERETDLESQEAGRTATQRGSRDSGRESSRGGGEWQGYVVPYRYYGRGHAGMGYYAVYFQGNGADASSGRGSGAEEVDSRPSNGFAGRGPKGYRRSDERIQEEINDLLTEHDELDASDIEVTVRDGEATLTGTVASRQAKRLAGDLAEGSRGVRDVMNQIRIADRSQDRSSGRGQSDETRQDETRQTDGVASGTTRDPDPAESSGNGSRRRTTAQASRGGDN